MHKFLAIFLAIGIVNATILPDQCQSLCNQSGNINFIANLKANQFNLTEIVGKLEVSASLTSSLNFWSELQATTVVVPVVNVQALVSGLLKEFNGSCSLGTLLVRAGVLFNLDVAVTIPSELFLIEVNLQALLDYLNTLSGDCSVQTLLVALINVVDGLLEIVAQVPGTLLSVVVALLRTNNQVDCGELVAKLQALLEANVTTLGPVLEAVAKLFNIKLDIIPSSLANITVNLSAVIALLVGKTGLIGINVVLVAVVSVVGSLLNLVTVVSGTLLSVLAALLSTNKQVNVADLLVVLQNCLDNGVNTLGPLLDEICKLFGLSVAIPSLIANVVVDVSAVIALLAGATGLIGIKVVLTLLGTAVVGLLESVVAVPGTLLSIIAILLSSGTECAVADLLATLNQLLEQGVNTLGPVLLAIAELLNVSMKESDIPEAIHNLAINLSVCIASLAGVTGSIGVNGILLLIATCVTGVLDLVVSVASGLLSVVNLLSSVTGLLSVEKLTAELSSLNANATLKVVLETAAKVAGVNGGLVGIVPKVITKTTGVLEPLLALLAGCSGSITVSYFISLIGCVLPAFLTVTLRQVILDVTGTLLQAVGCLLCTVTNAVSLLPLPVLLPPLIPL